MNIPNILNRNNKLKNLARIDMPLLLLFEALLAEGNLTRAAARIGMAQPSASKALDRLRDLFADPLFLRAPGGMRASPRAQALGPEVTAVIEHVRALVAEAVPFDPATAKGALRLAMSDAAEYAVLPGLLAALDKAAPGIVLKARPLDKDRALADLDAGRLDAVIGVFPDLPQRMRSEALFSERFVCLARKGHPALQAGLTLEAYATLPHLLVTLRDDARGAVDEALVRVGRQRRVLATLTRFLAVPAILRQTDAIATVPERLAAGVEGCEEHEPPIPVTRWTEQLIWRSGSERDPMLAWAFELVRRSISASCEPADAAVS